MVPWRPGASCTLGYMRFLWQLWSSTSKLIVDYFEKKKKTTKKKVEVSGSQSTYPHMLLGTALHTTCTFLAEIGVCAPNFLCFMRVHVMYSHMRLYTYMCTYTCVRIHVCIHTYTIGKVLQYNFSSTWMLVSLVVWLRTHQRILPVLPVFQHLTHHGDYEQWW